MRGRARGGHRRPLRAAMIIACWLMLLAPGPPEGLTQGPPPVFSTWEGFEADKCASVWLIKRFVDHAAVVRFFPKGETIREGIPFDTPEAKLRRHHNLSTFESILKEYRLQDPKLAYIGRIIHDIEINLWGVKRMKESREVQEAIGRIIATSKGNEEIVERSCRFLDDLYRNIP